MGGASGARNSMVKSLGCCGAPAGGAGGVANGGAWCAGGDAVGGGPTDVTLDVGSGTDGRPNVRVNSPGSFLGGSGGRGGGGVDCTGGAACGGGGGAAAGVIAAGPPASGLANISVNSLGPAAGAVPGWGAVMGGWTGAGVTGG